MPRTRKTNESETLNPAADKETNVTNTPNTLNPSNTHIEPIEIFPLRVDTLQGEKDATLRIVRWNDTGKIASFVIGNPPAYAQPVSEYYETREALYFWSDLRNGRYPIIDLMGLFMHYDFRVIESMTRGNNLGWVSMNYKGSQEVPSFAPDTKRGECYTTGWASLKKNDSVLETDFIAVETDWNNPKKYYGDKDQWEKAQNAYAKHALGLAMLKDGGITLFYYGGFDNLVDTLIAQWRMPVEEARKAASQRINASKSRDALRTDTRRTERRDEKAVASGQAVDIVTAIGGIALVAGAKYALVNRSGLAIGGFTYDLNNSRALAMAKEAKERVENKGYKLEVISK